MKPSYLICSILVALFSPVNSQEGPTALLTNLASLAPGGTSVSLNAPGFYLGCYPIGPKEAVAADFDGDGFKDIAVAKMEGVISILFWDQATQGFVSRRDLLHQPVADYDGSDGYRGVAAADLNRDGRMDVMAISPYNGMLYRYRNMGGRTFAAPQPFTLWTGARDCAAGDFNGDGITDLIVGGGDYSTGRNTVLNYRVMQLRGDGVGGFSVGADLIFPGNTFITGAYSWDSSFPKPVFSFAVYRPLGASADHAAFTHANTTAVKFLRASATGTLEVYATTSLPKPAHQLEAVDLRQGTGPRSGLPALVASATYSNEIYFTKADPPAPGSGAAWPWGVLQVAGLPRSVKVADFNGDGRKDLAVIHRAFNIVSLFTQGEALRFVSTETRPVGSSPRDLVLEDFNQNGKPDAVVLCRVANSLTVIRDFPGMPVLARSGIYPGSKGISTLKIADLNRDGMEDLLMLDTVKEMLVVRLSLQGRRFGSPASYPVRPGLLTVSDFNGDGHSDVGILSANPGLTILAGSTTGSLSPYAVVSLPFPGVSALNARDLTGDGLPEIAMSNGTSLAILRNAGSGQFTEAARHHLAAGGVALAFTDADQDGDLDIIAGGQSTFSLLRNDGNLLTGSPLPAIEAYDFSHGGTLYGTGTLTTGDFTNDGDPDIGIGTNAGFQSFRGSTGTSFVPAPGVNPSNAPVATSTLEADYDADGDLDNAFLCPFADLISIQYRDGAAFQARYYDIIGSNFLAAGDLDGDGKPDLVGGAEYIWAAYSSGISGQGDVSEPGLPKVQTVVINEILAVNDSYALPQDGSRYSDFLELYNGAPGNANLSGWTLTETDSGNFMQKFTLPPATTLVPGGRLVIVFANVRSIYHTGFKLTGDGSIITLKNAQGQTVDTVTLGQQQADVSFARPSDAFPSFVKNIYPDPGTANLYNGNPGPEIWDKTFDTATVQPNQPVVFRSSARADLGVARAQVSWRILGEPLSQRWISLFDDGRHDDGEAGDGDFAGALEPGLPAGTEIEFFYEAADLLNNITREPDSPLFTLPGRPSTLFTLKVPDASSAPLPLEISEVVSNNSAAAADEGGETADYIEIRNITQAPIDLTRYSIRSTLLGTGDLEYLFPQGAMLQPRQSQILWADGDVDQGPWHMPFTIEKNGGRLYVVERSGTFGTNTIVSSVDVPDLPGNIAWLRFGPGGPWAMGAPSPGRQNAAALDISIQPGDSSLQARVLFPTKAGKQFTLQSSTRLTGGWVPLIQGTGEGFERFWQEPVSGPQRYFRVQENP